jgi:hypothetical protein
MKRSDKTRLMSEYEKTHSVEDYVCFDWQVWPLMRIQVAYEAIMKDLNRGRVPQPPSGLACGWKSRTHGFLRKIFGRTTFDDGRPEESGTPEDNEDGFGDDHPGTVKGDVVLLSLSGRRLDLNGRYYEIYSDPIVSELEGLGVSNLVWECGLPKVPRYSRSSWIDRPLQELLLKQEPLPVLPEPGWFREFVPLAQQLLERDFGWPEMEKKISRLQQSCIVFEQWLREAEVKLLLSVCWYNPTVMAATLAAKKLGLVSVDLQHGLQDKGHFAYSHWDRSPAEGYGLVPDVFWTWGERQALQLASNAPAFHASNIVAGGNQWLNAWKRERCDGFDMLTLPPVMQENIKNAQKVILVTLQGRNLFDLVCRVIENSPETWFWLVRFHPATPQEDLHSLKERLSRVGSERVEYCFSVSLPLYLLLKNCDVHVTGHSTCALEALAFGKPTILASQDGADTYEDYCDAGLMAVATEESELVRLIDEFTVSSDVCEAASHPDFASVFDGKQALLNLLAKAGISILPPSQEGDPHVTV